MTPALFRRILCPVDLTGEGHEALQLARRLAERNGATLSLIHVMTPHVPGGVVFNKEREKAKADLELLLSNDLSGSDYQMIVRWGNVAREIVAAEAELEAELCVIATDGSLGASGFMQRSVAEKVARKSSCPVLTIGTKQRQSQAVVNAHKGRHLRDSSMQKY